MLTSISFKGAFINGRGGAAAAAAVLILLLLMIMIMILMIVIIIIRIYIQHRSGGRTDDSGRQAIIAIVNGLVFIIIVTVLPFPTLTIIRMYVCMYLCIHISIFLYMPICSNLLSLTASPYLPDLSSRVYVSLVTVSSL